jgi:ketosteroid isomerase-like protein
MKALNTKVISLVASILLIPVATAAPVDDVTSAIHHFIDAFNSGDTKAVDAAYATGSISITDEFAPFRWTGPHAGQAWAAAYDKHAQAAGVSDGNVKYSDSTRTEVGGDSAYAVVPVVYSYKEHGAPTQEEAQMTLVLHRSAGGWKIQAWTWNGTKPHPVKQ